MALGKEAPVLEEDGVHRTLACLSVCGYLRQAETVFCFIEVTGISGVFY